MFNVPTPMYTQMPVVTAINRGAGGTPQAQAPNPMAAAQPQQPQNPMQQMQAAGMQQMLQKVAPQAAGGNPMGGPGFANPVPANPQAPVLPGSNPMQSLPWQQGYTTQPLSAAQNIGGAVPGVGAAAGAAGAGSAMWPSWLTSMFAAG